VTANQLKAFIVGAGSVSVVSGKTLTVSNTLTLAGNDGASLNVGAGGTLGTAAFVNTGTSGGTVPLLNAGNTWSATQTITPAANSNALVVTGYSLTGANTQSLLDLAGTWNTSGKPSAIKLNITDTASNADSLLGDLQVGGATMIALTKVGTIAVGPLPAIPGNNGNPGFFVSNTGAAGGPRFGLSFESGGLAVRDGSNMLQFFSSNSGGGGFRLGGNRLLGWCATTPDGSADTAFARNAAGVIEINSGTAGTFRDLQLRALNGTSTATILSGTAIPVGGTAGSGYCFRRRPIMEFSLAPVRPRLALQKARSICAATAAPRTTAPTSTPMAARRGPLSRRRREWRPSVCRCFLRTMTRSA
jgi:hypothetical protein